jgi:hypothetical protein
MVSRAPPPLLRDRKLDLDELQRLARTFDGIGDEIGGARYPAVAFVKWWPMSTPPLAGDRSRETRPPKSAIR